MGLKGCYAVLKYMVFLMNLVFWVTGLIVLFVSVWMLVDPTFYVSMAQDESSYYSGVCILLLAGVLLFVVGFLGCFGAYNESPKLLILYFCGLLLILVAQISTGVWAYSNSDKLQDLLRYTVRNTVLYEYGKAGTQRTETFDAIQRELKCCGMDGPEDWSGSTWKGKDGTLKLSVKNSIQQYEIPASCCDPSQTQETCETITKTYITAPMSPFIFKQGCSDKLLEKLKDYMLTIIFVMIGTGIIEFFGLIFSLILCCAIRAVTKYK